jgi:hypothetical protein
MSRSESTESYESTTLGPGASHATGGNVTVEGSRLRDWMVGSILALSIVVNGVLIYAYRDAGTEQRLHEYEVSQLRVQADLNAELEKIILARGKCHE